MRDHRVSYLYIEWGKTPSMLADVNVALGVSGSIAAVRCVELAHELRRRGAAVRAITTPSAEKIIHPWSLEYATEHSVTTAITGAIEHVELCGEDGWADVLLIAPATANTIGKIAAAIDDTPVTTCATTAIGADIPVVIAPAMHEPMWKHPGVLSAIEQLEAWNLTFVPPHVEEGKAKLATNDAIATAVARGTAEPVLAGERIIVTSGPTSESIDPVRVMTNRSSGRMGRAIATACAIRGADVTLIHDGENLPFTDAISVTTAHEMREAALDAADGATALISAAAIGDFEIEPASSKLDSTMAHDLHLEPAPKLLDGVREIHPEVPIIGFKAEDGGSDEALIEAAREQRERLDALFVVANDVGVMGSTDARVLIVDQDDHEPVTGSKDRVANRIVDRLIDALGHERTK